jgi:methylamine dehydrogenase accessory protein MauD
MTEAVFVSMFVLWCVVIVLVIVVVALARQVGILHERVAPAGALMPTNGPKVGELTEAKTYAGLDGNAVTVGGANGAGAATLVLWVSPTCPVCRSLVPTAVSLSEYERLQVIFASDGDDLAGHRTYVDSLGIDRYPYLVSQALGMSYAVSKLPFAVLIGADGTLKSKGLVNTREHLESLVESMDSGIATLQDYLRLVDSPVETPAKERAL